MGIEANLIPSVLSKITFLVPSGLVSISCISLRQGFVLNPHAQELVWKRRVPQQPTEACSYTQQHKGFCSLAAIRWSQLPHLFSTKLALSLLKIFVPLELHLSGTGFSHQGADWQHWHPVYQSCSHNWSRLSTWLAVNRVIPQLEQTAVHSCFPENQEEFWYSSFYSIK